MTNLDRASENHSQMRIAVPNKAFSNNPTLVDELKAELTKVTINTDNKRYKGQELVDFTGDADAVIVELEDINALKIALKNRKIAGAAIDVYYSEPPNDPELIEIENLINTPHIAGNSIESELAMGRSAIESLVEYKKDML